MRKLNLPKTHALLSRIMEFELAGVVRYTHYSLMITGPNRIPIVQFLKGQASESLLHAQQAGEILTGLDGHPSLRIAPIQESYQHAVRDILAESLSHEEKALNLYKSLLDVVKDSSVYIEEFARSQIGQEELHMLEIRKMLRDVAGEVPHAHPAAAAPPSPAKTPSGGASSQAERPRSERKSVRNGRETAAGGAAKSGGRGPRRSRSRPSD